MKLWKTVGKLYGTHLGVVAVSIIMVGPLFGILKRWPMLYSFLTAWMYGAATYSLGWRCGYKDSRRIPGFYPDWKFPFQAAGYGMILSVVILILPFAFPNILRTDLGFLNSEVDFFFRDNYIHGTCDLIFKLWFFHLEAFLGNYDFWKYLLAVFYQPVLVIVGYFIGLKRYQVVDTILGKLVYRKEKEN